MRITSVPTRFLATSAAGVLLVLGLAACGDDSSSSTTTSGSGADEYVVVAKDIAYQNDLTVEPGEEFTFDNQDTVTHTLTADDGDFDSGQVDGGSTSDPMKAPAEKGTYKFHCTIHSSMHGTLTVQ